MPTDATEGLLCAVQEEATLLQSLSHPNIVACYETFVEGGKLYIIMEYADGGDLAAALRRRRSKGDCFTQGEALSVLSQCGRALQHIHRRHIVHRDVKSQNVFLTGQGMVKLGDFGVAKKLEETGALAQTMIGTPTVLAPEVCECKPYGSKVDIWSLGVVFYELLAMELPFRACSISALIAKIVTGVPKQLPEEHCCQEVRILAMRLLRKDPQDRPTAEQLLQMPVVSRCAELPVLRRRVRRSSRGEKIGSSPSRSTWRPVIPVPSSAKNAKRSMLQWSEDSTTDDALDQLMRACNVASKAASRAQSEPQQPRRDDNHRPAAVLAPNCGLAVCRDAAVVRCAWSEPSTLTPTSLQRESSPLESGEATALPPGSQQLTSTQVIASSTSTSVTPTESRQGSQGLGQTPQHVQPGGQSQQPPQEENGSAAATSRLQLGADTTVGHVPQGQVPAPGPVLLGRLRRRPMPLDAVVCADPGHPRLPLKPSPAADALDNLLNEHDSACGAATAAAFMLRSGSESRLLRKLQMEAAGMRCSPKPSPVLRGLPGRPQQACFSGCTRAEHRSPQG